MSDVGYVNERVNHEEIPPARKFLSRVMSPKLNQPIRLRENCNWTRQLLRTIFTAIQRGDNC